jgi:hypothetical protein
MDYMTACYAARDNTDRDGKIWRVWRQDEPLEYSIHRDGERPKGLFEVAHTLPGRGINRSY